MKNKSASSQLNGGPAKPIGIGHTGKYGEKAPKPIQSFKPIKYPTQGMVKVGGKLI